jgi:L,D-peptidoglycan transpeptidase YkuD (ErfK/YbiS/YcfS/YnhG family)
MEVFVDSTGTIRWIDASGESHNSRCALGRGGIAEKGREGDGITPAGRYALRSVMVRTDRIAMPQTTLPISKICQDDGWCDDPSSPDYNRRISTPHPASHENLWRDDELYNVIVEVGFNDDPVKTGRGSAIFMHIAKPGFPPTEGCVALDLEDLLALLKACDAQTELVINL